MKARGAKGAALWVLVSPTKRMELKQKEPDIFNRVVRYSVAEELILDCSSVVLEPAALP